MTPEDLAALHPRLYHVTTPGALPGILRHGLLPTTRLLDLYEVPAPGRPAIEAARRPASVTLHHPEHGPATVTDNLPLHVRALEACLDDALRPADWFRILNERVFLWADVAGMRRLLGARLNRGRAREVLVLDTLGVARAHFAHVAISAINSGATLRRAARRGLSTFTPLGQCSYREWRGLRGRQDRILEVTVVGGVADVAAHLVGHCVVPAGEPYAASSTSGSFAGSWSASRAASSSSSAFASAGNTPKRAATSGA